MLKRLEGEVGGATRGARVPGGGALLKGSVKSQSFFADEEGKAFWTARFGLGADLVEWNRLMRTLEAALGTRLTLRDEMNLKRVIDPSYAGLVSPFRFGQFLRGFGPLRACVANANRLLAQPWFHGFLSRREAQLLLAQQPVGTFLCRFSKTFPGSFALAFVDSSSNVLSVMVESDMPRGVKVREQGGQERHFRDLYELIETYVRIFLLPLLCLSRSSFHLSRSRVS